MVLFSCDKTDDLIVGKGYFNSNNPLEIVVVLPEAGLGDQSYNDLVYEGVIEASERYGDSIHFHVVHSSKVEDKKAWVRYALLSMLDKKNDCCRLILADNGYESLIENVMDSVCAERGIDRAIIVASIKDNVLLFESEKTYEYCRSFYIDYYGACYIAGAMANLFSKDCMIVMACPGNPAVESGKCGFTDGFMENGGGQIGVFYLSEGPEGYSVPNVAYDVCMEGNADKMFFFPLAGGSNMGVYKFTRFFYGKYTSGIDKVQSQFSNNIVFNVTKNIDVLLADYVGKWLDGSMSNEEMHRVYGLKDKATGVMAVDRFIHVYEGYAEYLTDTAIVKETEYERRVYGAE